MKLTIGFSPCPNDTFIFDALVNGKINTGGLEFDTVLEDVETLNKWALKGKLDITKLSLPAFFQSSGHYALLNSGSALGKGVGPLLISKHLPGLDQPSPEDLKSKVENSLIAIPGLNTTANFLLNFAFPAATNKLPLLFSKIENAVLAGEAELGVIIHENRFTYQQKGLYKVIDLGEYWERQTGVPIPLGAIAIHRKLERSLAARIDQLIRESLQYSFSRYPAISDYVKQHSQEMDEQVMRQHIELYVNEYSLDLGVEGRRAIETLQKLFAAQPEHSTTALTSSSMFIS